MTAPIPTQYTQIDNYIVKTKNRDWCEIGPKKDSAGKTMLLAGKTTSGGEGTPAERPGEGKQQVLERAPEELVKNEM